MRNLVRSLIAAERRKSDSQDTDARAAFRVCEKLRQSISALAGVVGFRTLLTRAVALAKADAPWLAQLKIEPSGSLSIPDSVDRDTDESAAAKGGEALVAQVLELLATFIGEALTRRIVQQIWPKIALDAPKSGGKT
jgi:hypothetical protein